MLRTHSSIANDTHLCHSCALVKQNECNMLLCLAEDEYAVAIIYCTPV